MPRKLSYKNAGVDIGAADQVKRQMARSIDRAHPLVLNRLGAFASLCDGSFAGYRHPVLVCKTEEPGSKQKIAFEHGRVASICVDLVHHLVNDMIVMGAKPLFVQDLIICGKLESTVVRTIVENIATACRAQGCVLTGGETSEQPGVLASGMYVLGASGIGVVEKERVIDGSKIRKGDVVLALASSGLHTNGYTLVRRLMANQPTILQSKIAGKRFLDAILTPHRCYYRALKDLFTHPGLHGLAHITGGGIAGNLQRILPAKLDAAIDQHSIRISPIFRFVKQRGNVPDADMRRTYNLGVGLIAVVSPASSQAVMDHVRKHDIDCYLIGTIGAGSGKVKMRGTVQW